jgi:hypothetical protein
MVNFAQQDVVERAVVTAKHYEGFLIDTFPLQLEMIPVANKKLSQVDGVKMRHLDTKHQEKDTQ